MQEEGLMMAVALLTYLVAQHTWSAVRGMVLCQPNERDGQGK